MVFQTRLIKVGKCCCGVACRCFQRIRGKGFSIFKRTRDILHYWQAFWKEHQHLFVFTLSSTCTCWTHSCDSHIIHLHESHPAHLSRSSAAASSRHLFVNLWWVRYSCLFKCWSHTWNAFTHLSLPRVHIAPVYAHLHYVTHPVCS